MHETGLDIILIRYYFFCPGKVFDDECMEELDGNIKMLSPGDMNSACIDGKSWEQFLYIHLYTYIYVWMLLLFILI